MVGILLDVHLAELSHIHSDKNHKYAFILCNYFYDEPVVVSEEKLQDS